MKKIYENFIGKTTDAYELIDFLKKNLSIELRLPIDIKEILKLLQIPYNEKPNFKQIKLDGQITISNGEPLIWANPMKITIEERKRFTLAHELGHFLLHIAPNKDLESQKGFQDSSISFNRDDNWDYKEMEANNFASQLLMPSSLLKDEIKCIINENPNIQKEDLIFELSKKFFVSEAAMKFRLKSMGV